MTTPVGYADCAVNLVHEDDPDPFACTFGIETDLSTWSALEHANHVFIAWAQSILTAQNNALDLVSATLRFGQDGGEDLIITSDMTADTGGGSGSMLPQNCAYLVKKVTGLGGRRNRGRFYVPYWGTEANVDQIGRITTGFAAAQALADDFLEYLALSAPGESPAVQSPMVLLHRSPASGGLVPAPTPVTSLVLDPVIATQRRRLRR